MIISTTNYRRFTIAFGILFLLYGGGGLFTYATLVFTGVNNLANFTNGMGLLFLGLMGAFAFPLGYFLLRRGIHSRLLLIIGALALGTNAIVRLSILAVPELLDLTGFTTPVVEFFVFGGLAIFAVAIRPNQENG